MENMRVTSDVLECVIVHNHGQTINCPDKLLAQDPLLDQEYILVPSTSYSDTLKINQT